MRYINKEYGFEGRPPFYNEFYEESSRLPFGDSAVKPEGSVVGFGLDKNVLNGALLAGSLGNIWGLKFCYQQSTSRWVEDKDFLVENGRYFASEVTDNFRYMCHGDLMVSMVKYDNSAVVLSFSTLNRLKLRLNFYTLTPYQCTTRLEDGKIIAVAKEKAIIKGDISLTDNDTIIKSRYSVLYDDASARYEESLCAFINDGLAEITQNSNEFCYETELDEKNQRVMVFLAVGSDASKREIPDTEELLRGVNNRELSYSATKLAGSGRLCGDASLIINDCCSFKIYNPYRLSKYYVENRQSISQHYNFEPTEGAIGGLISTLINDTSFDQVEVFSDDIIMGAISTWIAFCRTRKKSLLVKAYPKWLKKWAIDSKLIVVNPYTKREIGYKMDLSPLKDIKNAKLFSLEFNSYKLIALDVIEKAARILDKPEKDRVKRCLDDFRQKFNDMFFNNKLGLFMDRYEDGDFAMNVGVTSFLPLLGGAVIDNDMLDMLLINLKDANKFGFSCPVPTLTRDNPNYNKGSRHQDGSFAAPYEDYKGSVVAYLDYLVYLGLVRVGALEHASELAAASSKIYRIYKDMYGFVPSIIYPNYKLDSKHGKKSLSGNLLGLIGMSELIDVEYFNDDLRCSLRFGSLAQGEHRLSNVYLYGAKIDINIANDSTVLKINGRTCFEGIGARFVVRGLKENEDGLEFYIYSQNNMTITLTTPLFTKHYSELSYHTFNLESGKHKVVLKDKQIKSQRIV